MRAHWRQHGLAKFWWGDGFFSPDEEQQHSYRLAAILFRLLVTDHRRSLPLLIRHANAADAGDSALRESCGKTAAELMSQVLGSGEWTPEPPDSHAYCRRGAFYLEQKIISIAMTDLNRAIQLDPRVAEFYFYRGECFRNQHQFEAAIEDFHTAVQLDAKNFYAHNNLAWLFATCPDDRIRDADQAIEHANRACELSHFGPWFCLGTLAAAHAEAGDFDEARRWAKESLRFAPAAELPGCQERLKLYQAKQPWRDKPLRAL